MKKVIFLDVDGTIVDHNQNIPDSTIKALIEAKENGHYLVLCTGRIHRIIAKDLLKYFDGVVASAGAHILWGEEEIFHSFIPKGDLEKATVALEKHGATFVYQGYSGRVATEKNKKKFIEFFMENAKKDISNSFVKEIIEFPHDRDDIESGFYIGAKVTVEEIQKELGSGIKVTGASFGHEQVYNGELTREGVNKATGMERVLEHLGMQKEDSIAFGDGPNDFEMIDYAHIGVAMGNAVEDLKKIANVVTDHISEDGLYKGFVKLNLI